MPPPQANGQPPAEAVFTNGIHHYPGKSDKFRGTYANTQKNSQSYRKIYTVYIMNALFMLNHDFMKLKLKSS